jgi:hypothetical protein
MWSDFLHEKIKAEETAISAQAGTKDAAKTLRREENLKAFGRKNAQKAQEKSFSAFLPAPGAYELAASAYECLAQMQAVLPRVRVSRQYFRCY